MKAETISRPTVHSQLLQDIFLPAKIHTFIDPKLGHTTLYTVKTITIKKSVKSLQNCTSKILSARRKENRM